MRMSIDFCWHKAAECHHLAGIDRSVQNFFIRSRNSWIELANRLAVLGDATRVQYDEAWDSIMAGTAGAADTLQKMPRGWPYRLH
jgi:hypothetical protein